MKPEKDPTRIKRETTTLVVVDVQERLYPHIHGHEAMAVEIARLIKFSKIVGIPVVHAEQVKLGPTVEPLKTLLSPAQPLIKETFGCFGCDDFLNALSARKGHTLALTGIETHVCVLQTAMEALQRGYRVQVVADAVSSRSPYNKEVALRRIAAAGGEITCAESFIFEIVRKAGTEEFKEVLPLLK